MAETAAKEAKDTKETKETAPPPPPEEKKSSKLGLIIGAVVALLIAGVGVFFWMSNSKKPAKENGKKPAKNVEVMSVLHLETFVVNIIDPEQKTFLRIGIDLGLGKKPGKGEGGESAPVALVRDTILSVLSVQKPDDLLMPEGKTRLKEQLLKALQQRAPELEVQEVYFTEFLMQR